MLRGVKIFCGSIMKNFINLFQKFISKVKRDGIISALKKSCIKIYYDYLSKISLIKLIKYNKNKNTIISKLESILDSDYDRIIIWRSSIGFNIPLFQRPQQLALELSNNKTLVFFEVTRLTDKVDFIHSINDNLHLVNFSFYKFNRTFHNLINNIDKPKYLFTASTCWDISDKTIMKYVSNGYNFLYDYLDELSPSLAGTDKLPYNVSLIHNYVIDNKDTFVMCTADRLLNDMIKKRKSKKNIIYVSNGVDYNHFSSLEKDFKYNKTYENILKNNKPILGYYGALASWFDYDLIKYIANEKKDCNIVLIGSKYDTSFNNANLSEYKNIHYIGNIDYKELPYYASKFDVCLLPFKINDITKSTNPIKIFEYMALSKPIVSTDMNECRKYSPVLNSKTYEEFLNNINKSLKGLSKSYYEKEKSIAIQNTWSKKAEYIVDNLTKYESKYALTSQNITMAHILYKLYKQSSKYNVNNTIEKSISNKEKLFLITMNSETCMYAMKDKKYQDIVIGNDTLLVPDSISISYALKKTFQKRIKRYPGIEVLTYTLNILNEKKGSIFVFGATEKVNNDMINVIKNDYKNIKILGHEHGYVNDYEVVKDKIISLKPDLTVVALGVPSQELFINDVYSRLNKGMFIGVGGSLDVLSGNKRRAPLFMRKINLEWLYRIVTDPKRIRRFYDNNIKFVNDIRKGKSK